MFREQPYVTAVQPHEVSFARSSGEQNERDYAALQKAVETGTVPSTTGV
jgi:hypothetical protein